MLSVVLENAGKKFGREWIFRGLELSIAPAERIVILGGNGSGKSTLLQVIAGYVSPNEGQLYFESDGKLLSPEEHHTKVSLAAPYLLLPEDLTGLEIATHCSRFKPFINHSSPAEVLETGGLSFAAEKPVRQYSSGMKQRLRLVLAILADTELLLLDEPSSNLDRQAIMWYHQMIDVFGAGRAIVVCSNDVKEEHFFCDRQLTLADYK